MVIKTAALLLASIAWVYLSRASLAAPRSHGFSRFFSAEAILILAWLQADHWFQDPLSWHQIVSWNLLAVSLVLVIPAVRLLRQMGKPDPSRDEKSLIGFERTTALVTTGAYRNIRHPMYSSLLFLAWGIFFKKPSWAGGLLALAATLFLVAAAKAEEAENLRFFGAAYQEYREQTRMFIPFLF